MRRNSHRRYERGEATQGPSDAAPGLLRRFAPRNDDPVRSDAALAQDQIPEQLSALAIEAGELQLTDRATVRRRRATTSGPRNPSSWPPACIMMCSHATGNCRTDRAPASSSRPPLFFARTTGNEKGRSVWLLMVGVTEIEMANG